MTAKKHPVAPAAEQPATTQPAAASAPEQAAAEQPATDDAGHEPADTRSEREKQLEAENEQLRYELDHEVAAHATTADERDELREQLAEQPAGVVLSMSPAAAPAAGAEPSEEDTIREILTRNGLKKAWLLDSGVCFDEKHAQHVAGPDFDALTVIEVE